MKSREISRSKIKIGPFSLACTYPYIHVGIGWKYQPNLEQENV